ncbi:TilS substrate-binding domain-containing protein, partial [Cellulomonas endometrii]|uniref:TilS substrate-binding domain-containing protein n=1 Tax=Cellulomonas endometrii TaxID=3036301 RepID=UPI0024AD363C
AEGVLLGLARGSGARSLAGMPRVRGVLRRPLLEVTREQTLAACAALGLAPWHDPTNTPAGDADRAPQRSRVRTRVLPVLERELGPGVAAALARTAALLREDADALDALAAGLLERALVPSGPGEVLLDVEVLAGAPAALLGRALRTAVVRAGSPPGAVTREHVRAVAGLVTGWHGQGPLHLPGHVEASRACGRLAVREGTRSGAAREAVGRSAPGRSETDEETGDR